MGITVVDTDINRIMEEVMDMVVTTRLRMEATEPMEEDINRMAKVTEAINSEAMAASVVTNTEAMAVSAATNTEAMVDMEVTSLAVTEVTISEAMAVATNTEGMATLIQPQAKKNTSQIENFIIFNHIYKMK